MSDYEQYSLMYSDQDETYFVFDERQMTLIRSNSDHRIMQFLHIALGMELGTAKYLIKNVSKTGSVHFLGKPYQPSAQEAAYDPAWQSASEAAKHMDEPEKKRELGLGKSPGQENRRRTEFDPIPGIEQTDPNTVMESQDMSDYILDLYEKYKQNKDPKLLSKIQQLSKHIGISKNMLEGRLAKRQQAAQFKKEKDLMRPAPTNSSGTGSSDDDLENQTAGGDTVSPDQVYAMKTKKKAQTPTFQNSAFGLGGSQPSAPTAPAGPTPAGNMPAKPTRPNTPGSQYVYDVQTNQWVEVPTNQVKPIQ